MVEFDSLNPFDSLAVLIEDSPEALIAQIRKIRTPIKILQFVQVGNRSAVYIMGDHRIKKGKKDGSANSKRT